MPKKLSILGSTGKVGSYVLEVIDQNPDTFDIVGLSCHGRNLEKFINQIKKYKPEKVSVYDSEKADELRRYIDSDIDILSGEDGNIALSIYKKTDGVVTSLVGSAGLRPTYEAIKSEKTIYLANKETLVVAGEQILETAKENSVQIIPLDDEPAAIAMILQGKDINEVEKIYLSCSGGAFLGYTRDKLRSVTAEQAQFRHKFNMGIKISIESGLLWNKANEVIQASYLFDLEPEKIDVFVHPQATIHAAVQFIDGNLIMGAWPPSTKYAIAWALNYPKRMKNDFERLNLFDIGKFDFKRPNTEVFRCLTYGYQTLKRGGSMPAATYYASDVATDAFAEGKINILDIERAIKNILDTHDVIKNPSLKQILDLEEPVKEETKKFLELKD